MFYSICFQDFLVAVGELDMGLADMDPELDTDQEEAMVQDQGLDMEQVEGTISVLSGTVLASFN